MKQYGEPVDKLGILNEKARRFLHTMHSHTSLPCLAWSSWLFLLLSQPPPERVTRLGQPMNPQFEMAPIGVDRWGGGLPFVCHMSQLAEFHKY